MIKTNNTGKSTWTLSMLAPSELIIGNWYRSVKFNTKIKLTANDFRELYEICDGGELTSEIISQIIAPIPLTRAWLLDFGFKNNKVVGSCEYYSIEVTKMYSKLVICSCVPNLFQADLVKSNGDLFVLDPEIKSIHQVQNIYRELTRKH